MIQGYMLGNIWNKSTNYTDLNIEELINKFNKNNIPLSLIILGNKWHNTKENFTYDRTLFDPNILYKYYQSKKSTIPFSK